MVSLLIVSVFITAADSKIIDSEMERTVKEVADSPELAEEVYKYVEEFAGKKGVSPQDINEITQVDFNSLPKEVNIDNIDDTNLAIYQIDYNQPSTGEKDKLFVITYSTEQLRSQGDLIVAQDKREFLNFGFNGESKDSGFLKSATGVEGSLEKGYVMMRAGSITGISTYLEVLEGTGQLEIIIYKNGEAIQFGNTFVITSPGVQKDYDIQSKDIVPFEPGDIISLYVKTTEGISWKDVISLLEITTSN